MSRPPALASLGVLLIVGAPVAVHALRELYPPGAHSLIAEDLYGAAWESSVQAAGRQAEAGPPEQTSEALDSYTKEEKRENKKEVSVQERSERRDGFLITCMLIGAILFDMTILYLLNSSDPQVRSYTYKMLSTGLIVFCALLVQNFQEKVTDEFIHRVTSTYADSLALVLNTLQFCVWFFSISWLSWKLKGSHQDQYCTLNLVGHISAFTALEYIGHTQEHAAEHWIHAQHGHGHHGEPGQLSMDSVLSMYVLLPLIVWLGYRVCSQVAKVSRKRYVEDGPQGDAAEGAAETSGHAASEEHPAPMAGGDGPPALQSGEGGHEGHEVEEHDHGHGHGHGHHDWKMEAVHAEADSLAIVVGFLIKQCIAYLITARPVPLDCAKYPAKCHVHGSSIWVMTLPALGFYLALIPTVAFHARSPQHKGWLIRLTLVLGMTMSWLLVQMSEWLTINIIWDTASSDSPLHAKTVKKLVCASVLSPLFVVVILHVDALADWGIIDSVSAEATMQCIAFLIGFYWEKVFTSAIQNFTTHTEDKHGMGVIIPRFLIGLGLLCAIMPAWRWFLVPVACEPVPQREAGQKSISDSLLQSFRAAKQKAASFNKEEEKQEGAAGEGREGSPSSS